MPSKMVADYEKCVMANFLCTTFLNTNKYEIMDSVSPSVSYCTLCDTLCVASSLLAVVPVVTLLAV